jgi:citrate lyase subunit beta/citryl-CoA lyase
VAITDCRSLLFVPGNRPERVAKAFACGADVVIIDLEDSVPAQDKRAAREAAATAVERPHAVFVRVNGFEAPDCYEDLLSVVRPGLGAVVLPKAESAAQLATLDWLIAQLERQRGMPAGGVALVPLVETARGVESLAALAGATPRVRRLSFGVADYSLDLGLQPGPGEPELAYIRARLVHCSRAAGLEPPLDSVVVEVRDPVRFRDSASRARALGMGGKLCIHPDQVPVANEVFSPTPAELERARAIVAAFDAATGRGEAAITVGGEFVDAPVVERARRLLTRAGAPDGGKKA